MKAVYSHDFGRVDPRLAFVQEASNRQFEADKAAADTLFQMQIAPPDEDGFPSPLTPHDPKRAVANREHNKAVNAAEEAHAARVSEWQRTDSEHKLGFTAGPRTYPDDVAEEARQWVSTLTVPPQTPFVQARQLDPTSEMNRIMLAAYLRNPAGFEALFVGDPR